MNMEWMKKFLMTVMRFKEEMDELGVEVKLSLYLKIDATVDYTENPILKGVKITDFWGVLTTSDAVKLLLESDWGREGRTFREIMEALEMLGFDKPKTTLSGVLNYLIKRGVITRSKVIREGRKVWIYGPASSEG